MPKVWTDDAERMAGAHVPATTRFASKPALALVYGVGDIEMALKRAAKGYVLGVSATHLMG